MHFSNGNSWDPKVITMCHECGLGKICDACHRHGYRRGQCEVCPPEKKPDAPPSE
jgi:hypothetical protein